MKIERVEVRHLALPMKGHFTTSFGRFEDQHFVIVKAWSDGLVGYGEAASHFGPVYSSETPDSIYLALRDHILPCVVGQDFAGPQALLRALDWIRGNQYAKSAIEIALTNLLAQAAGQPLHTWLGGTQPEIRVGVSIGITPHKDSTGAYEYGKMGEFVAFDPVKGKRVWEIPEAKPVFGGALVTAGNVVFYGTLDKHFRAVDASTGNIIKSWDLECGVTSAPITFLGADGKQRVAITTGLGYLNGGFAGGKCPASDSSASGMVHVYKLP